MLGYDFIYQFSFPVSVSVPFPAQHSHMLKSYQQHVNVQQSLKAISWDGTVTHISLPSLPLHFALQFPLIYTHRQATRQVCSAFSFCCCIPSWESYITKYKNRLMIFYFGWLSRLVCTWFALRNLIFLYLIWFYLNWIGKDAEQLWLGNHLFVKVNKNLIRSTKFSNRKPEDTRVLDVSKDIIDWRIYRLIISIIKKNITYF